MTPVIRKYEFPLAVKRNGKEITKEQFTQAYVESERMDWGWSDEKWQDFCSWSFEGIPVIETIAEGLWIFFRDEWIDKFIKLKLI
jgi:hypothetical protein